ncbi:MAG: NAD(P)H-dependent oxidoreductase subunit E [Thiothrix sp.]
MKTIIFHVKMDAAADYLGLPETPYTKLPVSTQRMNLTKKAAAKYSISVCTNVSCMLCGSDQILEHVENKLGIKLGESTPDGKFFLKVEEECLAACSSAPMMQVNHVYHTDLTPEKVDEILDGLE